MKFSSRLRAKKLMNKYMAIAQPDKMATKPHPKTIRPWHKRNRPNPETPDTTRMAYYWMAMGISQLLK